MATEARDERWNFRVKPRSNAPVAEAATLLGTSKTAFVEESAVQKAESVIAEHRRNTLPDQDSARFVASLDAAPRTVPELVDLFSRRGLIPQS